MKKRLSVYTKRCKNLSNQEIDLMNKRRKIELGKNGEKDFKKDYPLETEFFFVMDAKNIVSFGGLMPIKINYLEKTYNILGICNIVSIKKGRGHGRFLVQEILKYLKKRGKTGLGFTLKTGFFEKAGLMTEKDFIKRFRYKNPATGKIEEDNEGDGVYYNGRDNFIKEVLSNKPSVCIDIPFW